MDQLVEERIARNDAMFRDANEQIGVAAATYEFDQAVPFICECADPGCSEIVSLHLEEYEEIRANSRWFLNVPGHEAAAQGAAVVIEERDGYVVVEKIGYAGQVAEALDERRALEEQGQAAASED